MATMTISLPEQMKRWIESQVEGGSYSSASDYLRDLVRRDREGRDRVYSIEELRELLSAARSDRTGGLSVAEVREAGRRIARANGWLDADD